MDETCEICARGRDGALRQIWGERPGPFAAVLLGGLLRKMSMRKNKPIRAAVTLSLLVLSGCGSLYTSVDVRPGPGSGVDVTVVDLTPETVEVANAPAYVPLALPAVFGKSPDTGEGSMPSTAMPEPRLPADIGPSPYLIGPGDVLSVQADDAPAASSQALPVRDDGVVDLPGVGELPVAGLTVEGANSALSRLLERSRLDPVLTLEVRDFLSRFVLVDGDVPGPGRVGMTTRPLTLDEAIMEVGGPAAGPSASVAHLFRGGEIYTIPLSDRGVSASLHLRHGDRVHVSGAYDPDRVEAWALDGLRAMRLREDHNAAVRASIRSRFDLERSSLEAERGRFEALLALDAIDRPAVFIAGEVQSPRRVPLPFGRVARLADVLFDEGGVPMRTGDYAAIYVLRLNSDLRSATAYALDGGNAAHLLMATRLHLRPDDLIFVAEQRVTRINRVLSQLTPSLLTAAGNGVTSLNGG